MHYGVIAEQDQMIITIIIIVVAGLHIHLSVDKY